MVASEAGKVAATGATISACSAKINSHQVSSCSNACAATHAHSHSSGRLLRLMPTAAAAQLARVHCPFSFSSKPSSQPKQAGTPGSLLVASRPHQEQWSQRSEQGVHSPLSASLK